MAAGPAAGSASAAAPANNSSTVWSGQNPAPAMPKRGLPLLYAPSSAPTLLRDDFLYEQCFYQWSYGLSFCYHTTGSMTPTGFDSSIDLDAVQTLNGFSGPRSGRYMRIEQLIGSNTMLGQVRLSGRSRQQFYHPSEITTGNIMVLDIFFCQACLYTTRSRCCRISDSKCRGYRTASARKSSHFCETLPCREPSHHGKSQNGSHQCPLDAC